MGGIDLAVMTLPGWLLPVNTSNDPFEDNNDQNLHFSLEYFFYIFNSEEYNTGILSYSSCNIFLWTSLQYQGPFKIDVNHIGGRGMKKLTWGRSENIDVNFAFQCYKL